jgi:UDP-N-acetyl-2-amino-2-deoxyglucuronate dehydrogenase
MSKNFILIGASGYVAKRHIEAIKNTNNNLIAASDINDSVGIIDSYFPDCHFFTSTEELITFILKHYPDQIDYTSICSPNYLHTSHCVSGLVINSNVICEKPLAITSSDLDFLKSLELKYNKKIYNIVQLRYHPKVLELKNSISSSLNTVSLKYITPRGDWYYKSWKTNTSKSGGLLFNIGIHLFDLLMFLFGDCISYHIDIFTPSTISGNITLTNANVNFFLSIDKEYLPKDNTYPAYRKIIINDNEFRFDKVFNDLHTIVYENILNNNGYTIDDISKSILLVEKMTLK